MTFNTKVTGIASVAAVASLFLAAARGCEARPATPLPTPAPAAQEPMDTATSPAPTEPPVVREATLETLTETETPEPAPAEVGPAKYTKSVVAEAIERYEEQGLEAAIAYHNDEANVEGQWYVFILSGEGEIISHFSEHLIGENLSGPQGTDAYGYTFGTRMLAATEDGHWVSYVYNNPAKVDPSEDHQLGDAELKHAWVKRHDGLLFGSGWYVGGDEFAEQLVTSAVDVYRQAGLQGTIAHFAGPDNATAGLSHSIAYYNANESIEGAWFALIADEDRNIVASYDVSLIGQNAADVYGDEILTATEAGGWVTGDEHGTLRAWMQVHDGMLFGSGWHKNGS